MSGNKIGPYEVIEEIGRGGMARVYRAYDRKIDRFVAVKVINTAFLYDETAIERFSREARLAARLEHPNILPIYNFDSKHNPPYIAMRYIPTGTLREVMDRGLLQFGEILHIFRQVCPALDYAHRLGVVHRDIKPSNIMIDQDGNALITDFGIARVAEGEVSITKTNAAIGTPHYMSPEQGLGAKDVDGRADLYSMGVLLFEMLVGRYPYIAETGQGIIMKHITEPIPYVREFRLDVPEEIAMVVYKSMEKKAHDRYQTGAELVKAIETALGMGIEARNDAFKTMAQSRLQQLEDERRSLTPYPDDDMGGNTMPLQRPPTPPMMHDPMGGPTMPMQQPQYPPSPFDPMGGPTMPMQQPQYPPPPFDAMGGPTMPMQYPPNNLGGPTMQDQAPPWQGQTMPDPYGGQRPPTGQMQGQTMPDVGGGQHPPTGQAPWGQPTPPMPYNAPQMPYGQPQTPWGQAAPPTPYGQQGAIPPPTPYGQQAPPTPWGQPSPPPIGGAPLPQYAGPQTGTIGGPRVEQEKRKGVPWAIIAIVVILLIGGAGGAFFLFGGSGNGDGDNGDGEVAQTSQPTEPVATEVVAVEATERATDEPTERPSPIATTPRPTDDLPTREVTTPAPTIDMTIVAEQTRRVANLADINATASALPLPIATTRVPTITPTSEVTNTPTRMLPSFTPTATDTIISTPTPTFTSTVTSTPTVTPTELLPTNTPSNTPTIEPIPVALNLALISSQNVRNLSEIYALDAGAVTSLGFSRDGRWMVTGGCLNVVDNSCRAGRMQVWDMRGGTSLADFVLQETTITSVAVSDDGEFIAGGDAEGLITVIAWQTGDVVTELRGHGAAVESVTFRADGGQLASGGADGTLQLWDVDSGRGEVLLEGDTSARFRQVVFSPNGQYVAATNNTQIRVVNLQNNREVTFNHDNLTTSVAFSSDGSLMAGGTINGTIRVWNFTSQTERITIQSEDEPITDMSFSSDGRILATSSDDGLTRLWEISSGQEINSFEHGNDYVFAAKFSPDGTLLASGSWDGTVRVWGVFNE